MMNQKLRLKAGIVLFLLIVFILELSVYVSLNKTPLLKVAFLDVGQGDAIYIESPNGNQVLIDGGRDKSVERELSSLMKFYDKSIDVVVATHADEDHVGGLPDVLERYKVKLFLEPGVKGESKTYEELENKVQSLSQSNVLKKVLARKGMLIDLGSNVKIEILFPDRDLSGSDTNTSSIVSRVIYGENEFLLTGDSPLSIEKYLISKGASLESDVLKAGHHGSKTSTSDEYVKAVKPKFAVISAGKDNKYGHPHQSVLDILNNNKVKILRTDEVGRILFESDGINLKIK